LICTREKPERRARQHFYIRLMISYLLNENFTAPVYLLRNSPFAGIAGNVSMILIVSFGIRNRHSASEERKLQS